MAVIRAFALICCLAALPLRSQKLTLLPFQGEVEMYGMQELAIRLDRLPPGVNPFTDASLEAVVALPGSKPDTLQGFCDSQDGLRFAVRHMPAQPGRYQAVLRFTLGGAVQTRTAAYTVLPSGQDGPLRADPEHPWHFIYENSGRHFFWNSTTAYWLMGWKDEQVIREAIDRLAYFQINRIRVAINGRAHGGSRWSEPAVVESPGFTFKLNPWLAERPEDLDDPGFDVTRFNVPYWQKLDRLVAHARDRGIIVSLIFYVDGLDHGCDPFKRERMGNADEQRYYRYAAARYSAFPNIMWDVTNEYHLFRSEAWVEQMGTLLKAADPHRHLISVHGHADFPFRTSPWVDVVLYQSWDECGGYAFMSACREKQAATGRILPQINEEYGYEGHYSPWGCGATAAKLPHGRSAENRARLAWEICMAGGYQTTGETAQYGTGAGEDTGGGWINGRGNYKMTMLKYYGIMREIFSQTEYWKLQPDNASVNYGNFCLSDPGRQYLVYSRLPRCRVALPRDGVFSVTMHNPRTGEAVALPDCDGRDNGAWNYPRELEEDWVFILRRK
ncbi:MAG: DUF4038 domain-containing protein [Bacteroidia bacterium]|nr:DUF4038 domain-containing protein [Bacteroidia bacterium]